MSAKEGTTGPSVKTSPPSLPLEIIRLVAKTLHAQQDLPSLTRLLQTSRVMYELIIPYAYDTVGYDTPNLIKLFSLLQDDGTGSLICLAEEGRLDHSKTSGHPVKWIQPTRVLWMYSHIRRIVWRPITPSVPDNTENSTRGFAQIPHIRSSGQPVLGNLHSLVIDHRLSNCRIEDDDAESAGPHPTEAFLRRIVPYLKPRFACHNIFRTDELDLLAECLELASIDTIIQHDIQPEFHSAPLCLGNLETGILDFAPGFNTAEWRVDLIRDGFKYFFGLGRRLKKILITKPGALDADGDDEDEKTLRRGMDQMFQMANLAIRRYRVPYRAETLDTDDEDGLEPTGHVMGTDDGADGEFGERDEQDEVTWGYLEPEETHCPACGSEWPCYREKLRADHY